MISTVPKFQVCGIDIAAISPRRASELVANESVVGGRSFQVHLCNAYTLSGVDSDLELSKALRCSDLNLPDGAPVAWLGWRRGVRGPVRGAQLVVDVMALGESKDLRHYLLGGRPGIAQRMADRAYARFPNLKVCGVESPPFHNLSESDVVAIADRVKKSGAQVVWVGIGTPKQDYLVPRLASYVDATIVPVGAAFDFLAGAVRQAPTVFHGSGFEWLYRFIQEPRRLWRRYFFGIPRFVFACLAHHLGTR